MVCFLEGPLVVICIFLSLLTSLENDILWILIIFLSGRTENAFFSFRIFSTEAMTCANDLDGRGLIIPLVVC